MITPLGSGGYCAMATSAPPQKAQSKWVDAQRGESCNVTTTEGLELVVSGMSLVSVATGPPPGLSAPSMSLAGGDMFDVSHGGGSTDGMTGPPSPPAIARPVPQVSKPPGFSGPSSTSIGIVNHSKSSSANSPLLTLTPSSSVDGNSDLFSLGRQGSPFGGEGPTMPSLPADQKRTQMDDVAPIGSFGSFELTDNDGLLGLDALPRERAQSSPGPMVRSFSKSPPPRGDLHGHRLSPYPNSDDDQGGHSLLSDSRRPRTISRDSSGRSHGSTRPPLSGSGSVPSPTGESGPNSGVLGVSYIPLSGNSPTNSTRDTADTGGFGVISRPDFRSALPSDGVAISRRRSISTESGRELFHSGYLNQESQLRAQFIDGQQRHSSFIDPSLSQKFGSLPSLHSHVQHQHQRVQSNVVQPSQHAQLPQRHHRSFSQPGPMKNAADSYQMHEDYQRTGHVLPDNGSILTQRFTSGAEGDLYSASSAAGTSFIPGARPVQHNSAFGSDFGRTGPAQRSMSMSHPGAFSHSFDGAPAVSQLRRSSMTNLSGGSSFFGGQPNYPLLHRRESLDFVPGHNRHFDSGTPIIASTEELRMFGIGGHESDRFGTSPFLRQERHVSPSQSPLHVTYSGSHSRNTSDGGTTMSASPGSMTSSVRPCHSNDFNSVGHHRVGSLDDDLTHPLVGEHIEVPGDDPALSDIHAIRLNGTSHLDQGPYTVYDSGNHLRGSMGHGTMLDPLPPHYGLESAHHLPTAGAALPLPKVVYNVKFKRTQRSFVLGPRINRDLKIGTYVKVEADRGEDLGIVIAKVPLEKFNVSGRTSFRPTTSEMSIIPPPTGLGAAGAADLKRIIRLATHDEVSLLAIKKEEEEELLKVCRGKVRQRGLPMHVVDAEYQFDRHKLTFFFEAEGRIDFRELVRDLFSMYKTRIWMQQLDKNTTGIASGIVSPPSTMMDYGVPIIAPEYRDYPSNGADISTN